MAVTWDNGFNATPAPGDSASAGDDRIRELKAAIQERITKEHEFDLANQTRQGLHRAGTAVLKYATTAPTRNGVAAGASDTGLLWYDTTASQLALKIYSGSAWVTIGTDAATAYQYIKRDSAGRAKVVAGSASTDIATKGQLDTAVGDLTAVVDEHLGETYIGGHAESLLVDVGALGSLASALTLTVPANVTKLRFLAIGAGGSGDGGDYADSRHCGGGGGGGGARYGVLTVAPGDTLSYSIGVGGSARSDGQRGVAGTNTLLKVNGTTVVTAVGGSGGLELTGGAGGSGGSGGSAATGASGTTGDSDGSPGGTGGGHGSRYISFTGGAVAILPYGELILHSAGLGGTQDSDGTVTREPSAGGVGCGGGGRYAQNSYGVSGAGGRGGLWIGW